MNLTLNTSRFTRSIPFLIGFVYLALAIASVQFDDLTADEQDHLNYGISFFKGHTSRQQPGYDFNTTMPVTALNALPRAIEQIFTPALQRYDGGSSDTHKGRYITILVTLLLLTYVFHFAKELAGYTAGYFAMLLVALDPNILAHSRLVTTDTYGTLGFIAVLFHLHRWLVGKKVNHFYYWCVAIALAQCCKINNILLYPLSFIAIFSIRYRASELSWRKMLGQVLFFLAIQLLVINAVFLFYHTGMRLTDYTFKSHFFQTLQQSAFAGWPMPLPQSYIDTFDQAQYERESFAGTANNYLMGELRYKQGFWNYYFVCWAVKTPALTQLLCLAVIATGLYYARFRKEFICFVLLPVAATWLLTSSSSVQGGYRYLLPALILLLIAGGILLAALMATSRRRAVYLACLLLAIPALFGFPNYIAYTSEWLWPKKSAYRFVSDSNLNWGQRSKHIKEILAKHPEYIFEPEKPVAGKIVVDINHLTGIFYPEKFEWLRKQYQPQQVIEGCYLLFDVQELP